MSTVAKRTKKVIRTRAPGAGRKKIADSKMLSLRIESELFDNFEYLCLRLGRSKTDLLSEVMQKRLDEQNILDKIGG